jgi:two-component system chemotaxis response regulator CheB
VAGWRRDVVVVGASAGGVEALRVLVRGLPSDFAAAVFVVQHVPLGAPSFLPAILARSGSLPARNPDESPDGVVFEPGTIYVAPPDRQMVIQGDRVRSVAGADGYRHVPAIDLLFRTAAWCPGRRVVGVILTGALYDGTAGLAAVASRGGIAVVQDPGDALFPSMPRNAMSRVDVDHCLPLAEIPALLEQITRPEALGPTSPEARLTGWR